LLRRVQISEIVADRIAAPVVGVRAVVLPIAVDQVIGELRDRPGRLSGVRAAATGASAVRGRILVTVLVVTGFGNLNAHVCYSVAGLFAGALRVDASQAARPTHDAELRTDRRLAWIGIDGDAGCPVTTGTWPSPPRTTAFPAVMGRDSAGKPSSAR